MNANQTVLGKVTAFITRDDRGQRELLVFRHPYAGIQLPAGTVEAGESFEEAVLRETREETGLIAVEIVSHLGVIEGGFAADQLAVLRTSALQSAPNQPADERCHVLSRGAWVRALEFQGGYAYVLYEEHNLDTPEPTVLVSHAGWLSADALTHRVERHLFHLRPTTTPPERWSVSADGHVFELFWLPLVPRPGLVAGEGRWLDQVYSDLQR